MTESTYFDDHFLPFTVEELVAADVLLGMPEAEARMMWTEAYALGRREREDPSNNAIGISMTGDLLAVLSLVSDELAERVARFRRRGREANLEHWRRTLPPEEVERRVEELRRLDQEWERKREELRRKMREGS